MYFLNLKDFLNNLYYFGKILNYSDIFIYSIH